MHICSANNQTLARGLVVNGIAFTFEWLDRYQQGAGWLKDWKIPFHPSWSRYLNK